MSAPTPANMPGAQEKAVEVTLEQARSERDALRAEVNAYKHRDRIEKAVKENPSRLGGFEYCPEAIPQDLDDEQLLEWIESQRKTIIRNLPGRVRYQADQGKSGDIHVGYDPLREMMDGPS